MRYRELIAAKGNMVKMTSTVDHLWAVKEIEYGNVVEILGTMKKTRWRLVMIFRILWWYQFVVIMFHWSNPQQFGHWPPSPMPASGSPHKFTSNQAPRVTFNYAPTQGNKYMDAIKLNEWNQPNNSIRYHTYEPGFQTSNPGNTRHLDRNIIV